jgi:outer membrane protein assembly factor BamD
MKILLNRLHLLPMNFLKSVYCFLFVLPLVVGCSDFNKVVKSDDYTKKMEMANAYFDKGLTPRTKRNGKPKQTRAGELKLNENTLLQSVTLYEQIYQRMPRTGEGELAYFRIGKAYYHAMDYYMAGYYLGSFTQRFPSSVKAQEAMFLSAMCSVKNSPEFKLDQHETELAINNLQQFINRYPESSLIDSCNQIMDRLRLKMEKKDYEAVKLYVKMQDYRAAVASAQGFIEDYPRSQFKEEVAFQMVKNSYLLAANSIEDKKRERIEQTIERCNTFAIEFSNSAFINEVNRYRQLMDKELGTLVK